MLQKTQFPLEHKLSAGELLGLGLDAARSLYSLHAPLDLLERIRRINSDRLTFSMGHHDFIILKNPDDVAVVLSSPAHNVGHAHVQKEAVSVRSHEPIITSADGDIWKSMRKKLAGFMGKNGLRAGFSELAEQDALTHLDGWHDQSRINVERESNALSLRFMLQSFFNYGINQEETAAMGDTAATLHRYLTFSMATLGKCPKPIAKALSGVDANMQVTDRLITRLIEHYDSLDSEQKSAHMFGKIFDPDVTDAIKEASYSSIRARVNEMLVAGHLSVRVSFYWAMHHLARNPELQDRIAAEAIKNRKDGLAASFRPSANGELSTISKVVLETLRLHPPLYVFGKGIKTEFNEISGMTLKPGTTVFIPAYLIQRDERFYEKPQEFDPDLHFAPEAMRHRHKFAYLPFGHGPQNCPGSGASLQQLCSTLSAMCERYQLEPTPGQEPLPRERADIMLRSDPATELKLSARPH